MKVIKQDLTNFTVNFHILILQDTSPIDYATNKINPKSLNKNEKASLRDWSALGFIYLSTDSRDCTAEKHPTCYLCKMSIILLNLIIV